MTDHVVDLSFSLRGNTVPVDHGQALYAAVSREVPAFHTDAAIGIHPIRGRLVGQRRLALDQASRLVLRMPAARLAEAIRLAGRRLDLDGSPCTVGVPSVLALQPVAALMSRLVVIRGFTEPEPFLDAVQRQLNDLGIAGTPSLLRRTRLQAVESRVSGEPGTSIRRTLRIHDREIIGFAVRVDQLEAADSLRLQESGIGGRRRFGCGVFVRAMQLPLTSQGVEQLTKVRAV